MKCSVPLFCILLLFLTVPARAEIYKCVDEGGNVRYSTTPGPGCVLLSGSSSQIFSPGKQTPAAGEQAPTTAKQTPGKGKQTPKGTIDWKKLAGDLKSAYSGKIKSIEQLNSTTCWAVLSGHLTNFNAVKIAENIGYYIRNATGGVNGETPTVRVFKNGKHIAMARPAGMKYVGKVDLQDWGTEAFEGEYRPK